jgi:hypothetical protein
MIHRSKLQRLSRAIALVIFLCAFASPALGGDRPWQHERWNAVIIGYSPSDGDPSVAHYWSDSALHTQAGDEAEASSGLSLDEKRKYLFNLQSPPAGEWAPGVMFEVRF